MTPRRTSRAPSRLLAGLAALVLLVLAAGCASDSDAPQDIFRAEGSNAHKIADLNFVYVLAAIVALLVFAVTGFVMWRFRDRKDGSQPIPAQLHGNTRLEIMWTIAPAVLLAAVSVPTVVTILDLSERAPDALEVTVVGQQWWWEFDYPSLKDADGLPIVTSGEMVIPAGRDVQLSITSRDVIHSFWIPRLNGKRDAVPNRVQPLRMQADEAGEYWGQCTEFCGLSHANMRMRVVALSPEDWDRWVENQLQNAAEPTDEVALRGKTTFVQQCARCHQVDGITDADGEVLPPPNAASQVVAGAVPNLTHLMSRTTFAGGSFDLKLPDCTNPAEYTDRFVTGTSDACLNRADLERWIRNAPAMKPMYVVPNEQGQTRGMPALGLTEDQIDDVVAYLSTLK
jgi:cytochrome c oxidase subunit 2